jgi:CubicO group peptidase (beta-lactamase class C family)
MSATPVNFRPTDPASVGLDPDRLARADALLDGMTADGTVTGAALVVARRGRLAYERYAGLAERAPERRASADTRWLLASITKPVAAAGVMLLVERGLLSLDEPVARLLPGFGVNGKEGITTRHLLTHTSGIDERIADGPPPTDASAEERRARLYAVGVTWPPGSRTAYNNLGFALLADIIAAATGEPHTTFFERELFAPLGMIGATLGVAPARLGDRLSLVDDVDPGLVDFLIGAGNLAGGLVSTPRDVAAFGQLFLDGGRVGDRLLLASPTIHSMLQDHAAGLEEADGDGWAPAAGRGLAWRLNLRRPSTQFCDLASPSAYGHGGATGTLLVVDPAYELVIAFMANRWGWAGPERRRLLNAVHAAITD